MTDSGAVPHWIIDFMSAALKAEGHTFDIAPLSDATSLQKRSGMARVVEEFHSSICEWNEPYLLLPFIAEAGPHLPTPGDGRLTW